MHKHYPAEKRLLVLVFFILLSSVLIGKESVFILSNSATPTALRGEWNISWGTVSPEAMSTATIQVPGAWNHVSNYPAEGSAVYSTRIHLPEHIQLPTLYLSDIYHNAVIYIDGNEIFRTGNPSPLEEHDIPRAENLIIPLPDKKDILLQIAVSNHFHRKGGMVEAPVIGSFQLIRQQISSENLIISVILGIILFSAVYHLILYFFYRNKEYLYFAFFNFSVLLRSFSSGSYLLQSLVGSSVWQLTYFIEYVSLPLAGISLCLYAYSVFPRRVIFRNILIGLGLLQIILITVTSISIYNRLISFYVFYLLLCGGYCMTLLFFHAKTNPVQSILLICSLTIMFATMINDYFYYNTSYDIGPLGQYGIVVLVISQHIFLSRSMAILRRQHENYQLHLESEVTQRTMDLRRTNKLLIEEIRFREKVEEQLEYLSTTDHLTGLYNRLKFNESLKDAITQARRYDDFTFSLLLFDLDDFKRQNDEYGHDFGDEVLELCSQAVARELRESDIFARWGGEEFTVLMRNTKLEGAIPMAERIRLAIEQTKNSRNITITASLGVCEYQKGDTIDSIFKQVDTLMYFSKNKGKNCVSSPDSQALT